VATIQAVPEGELGVVASIDCQLPDVGTSASVPIGGLTSGPAQVTISVEFAAHSAVPSPAPRNSWNATLFPRWVSVTSPTLQPIKVTEPALQKQCGFSDCELLSSDDANASVYLTTALTDELVARAEAGGVIVLLQESSSSHFFKSERTNYKQACERCTLLHLSLCQ
jgi:hypothetical protein